MDVVSLFAGAGGLDLGLVQAGHTIAWANDNDLDAVATYRENLGSHIDSRPIQDIDVRRLPAAEILVGGFPCQGFSQANLRRRVEDERNSLYRYFVEVLTTLKPDYFLAENVRGIKSLGGGEVLKAILRSFTSAGYSVEFATVNAADFGVPQNRHRVLFAGTKNRLSKTAPFRLPSPTHTSPRKRAPGRLPWVTIGEALASIPEPDSDHDLANHVCSQYKVTNRNFTGHRRTDGSKPSPTILARGNGGGGVCAIQHPNNHRRLSVRESAIIQTFPDDFVFEGRLNSMYRQVGNAVPVQLAERIGQSLMNVGSVRGRRCA